MLGALFTIPMLAMLAPVLAAPTPMVSVIRTINGRAVEGSFIVKIKAASDIAVDGRGQWLNNVLARGSAVVDDTESLKLGWPKNVFDGLSGNFDTNALNALRASPDVEYIVEDTIMTTQATLQQANAPWGIARLASPGILANPDPSQLDFQYTFDSSQGEGVDIYVIDTGIRVSHLDFGGRATFAASFGAGVPNQDLNGHGTHVAGTAAGGILGVAKKASLFAVKVMGDDGSGATSDIISGIAFATQAAQASGRPSVINMSIGGPVNQAIDAAAANAVAAGVHVVVAAGNETQDSNNSSPARTSTVITVGATDINDSLAGFSNFGNKVDILAPGQDILSASFEADDGVRNLSGTSMASPHIAGLAAYFLGLEGQKTPAALRDRLIGVSKNGLVDAVPAGTANELASNIV
jgi:cerevisin